MEARRGLRAIGPNDIQKEMERYFEHLGRWKRPVFYFEKAWKPLCNVSEGEKELVVLVELAGVDIANVEITVEDNYLLIISGFRREQDPALKQNYHMVEISYGTFERVIQLPASVLAEEATATYEDGLLEIRLPKTPAEPGGEV